MKPSRCDKIVFGGIVVLLIFAPLAFGSVHVWAYSLVEIGVFSLITLWFLDRLVFSKRVVTLEWVKTPVNGLLFLFILIVGFQLLPLPTSWVAFISPKTLADKRAFLEVLENSKFAISNSKFAIPNGECSHEYCIRNYEKLSAYKP